MTLHFSKTLGGVQLRGDNEMPYQLTHAESTAFENETGDINKGPFVLLAVNDSEEYWRGVEAIFLDEFADYNDFKEKHPKTECSLYIFYGTQTERSLILHMFSDIKEYLNHA